MEKITQDQKAILDTMAEDMTVDHLLQLEDEAYADSMMNLYETGALQSEDL